MAPAYPTGYDSFSRSVTATPSEDGHWPIGGVQLPNTQNTGKKPFRPDATPFNPHGNNIFYHPNTNIAGAETHDPFYPLECDTFVPPESPAVKTLSLRSGPKHTGTLLSTIPEANDVASNAGHLSQSLQGGTYMHRPPVPSALSACSTSSQGTAPVPELVSPKPKRTFGPHANLVPRNTGLLSSNFSWPTASHNKPVTPWNVPVTPPTTQQYSGNSSSIKDSDKIRGVSQSFGNTEITPPDSVSEVSMQKGIVNEHDFGVPLSSMPAFLDRLPGCQDSDIMQHFASPSTSVTSDSTVRNVTIQTKAQFLAEMIRQGRAEASPGNKNRVIPSTAPFRITSTAVKPSNLGSVCNSTIGSLTPASLDGGMQAPSVGLDPIVQAFLARGKPALEDAFAALPFTEECRGVQPVGYGVVKITEIPYGSSRPEIVALLGRYAGIARTPAGSQYFAVHIIMERSSGKSMDCFVEFQSEAEAELAIKRFHHHRATGHQPRLGDRKVKMELSTQNELMAELFPRAKCVEWRGQKPKIHEPKDSMSAAFNGFTSGEELVMLVKFAETPTRSRFLQRHEQRVYESMISLITKYPWWEVSLCTIEERNRIFNAALAMTTALSEHLRRDNVNPYLSAQLLLEFVHVILACPGFNESQRACIANKVQGLVQIPVPVSPLAADWPFQILNRKSNTSEQLMLYYAGLLKSGHMPSTSYLSLAERAARGPFEPKPSPFGEFGPNCIGLNPKLTLAEASMADWNAIEDTLRKVL